MDIFSMIGEQFSYEPQDPKTYSPLALAYIGDGIYELVIRSLVIGHGNASPNHLHREASTWVNAGAQCEMYDAMQPYLTEEEKDYFRRGRNAKSGSMAKHATMWEYRRATGFEALMGYLYLSGQMERMMFLIRTAVEARSGKTADNGGEQG